jgi:hypothetical protein
MAFEPWPGVIAEPPLLGFATTLIGIVVVVALQSVKELEV